MTELRDELSSPSETTFEHLEPLLAARGVRNVLRANAVVSASTGLLAALAAGPLAGLLDVPAVAVRGIGHIPDVHQRLRQPSGLSIPQR